MNDNPDSDGRVKCLKCSNRVLQHIALDNGGLCGVCFKRIPAYEERQAAINAKLREDLEKKASIPVGQLDDTQKHEQLWRAILCKNNLRIFHLLSSDTGFVSQPPPHSNQSWIGHAISTGCDIEILNALFEAGCVIDVPGRKLPLETAVEETRLDAVRWLLSKGADPNRGRPAVGAINYAKSSEDQKKLLTLLIEGGLYLDNTYSLFGDEQTRFTVLDWALLYQIAPDVIGFLKENGATTKMDSGKIVKMKRQLKRRRIVP